MKTHLSIGVLLLVISIFTDHASALECYSCDPTTYSSTCKDPFDIANGKKQDCSATAGGGAGGGGAAEEGAAEEPAARRLVAREEAGSSDMFCAKLVGKMNGTDAVVRGCSGAGCSTLKITLEEADQQCFECADELCNYSVKIQPIGWICLFAALTCTGLKNLLKLFV